MPFVKKVKPAEPMPAGTVVLDPPKKAPTVTTCRQELGMARAREEDAEAQFERAQREFATLSKESVDDDRLDLSAVAGVMRAAQEKMDDSERVLAVARRRRTDVEEVLKAADLNARREELRKQLVQLGIEGQSFQETLDVLPRKLARLTPLMDKVRALGFDSINQQLNTAQLAFKPRLLHACRLMPNCAVAEAWFLKDEPWVESLPKPSDADRVK
jgi:hypothetical protein